MADFKVNGITPPFGNIKYGTGNVQKIYSGTTLVWPLSVPTLDTITPAIGAGNTVVTSGGENIITEGGPIIEKGVEIDNFPNFVSVEFDTSDGTGTNDYTSTVSGLDLGTTYYIRAYATNSAGTGYGNILSFISNVSAPCDSVVQPGGAGVTDFSVGLDSTGGVIAFLFNPFGQPDKMEIIHGGPDGTKKATTNTNPAPTDQYAGNYGPFDNNFGTEPSNSLPTYSQTILSTNVQFVGTQHDRAPAPFRDIEFYNDTGLVISNETYDSVGPSWDIANTYYQQVVWWKYTAADFATNPTATVRVTGQGGTGWDLKRVCF